MSNLKSLKFDELIYLAKHVSYIKPDKEYESWTEDEILFHAMYLGINNNIQMDSIIITCKAYPPVKLIAKEKLRQYIQNYLKS